MHERREGESCTRTTPEVRLETARAGRHLVTFSKETQVKHGLHMSIIMLQLFTHQLCSSASVSNILCEAAHHVLDLVAA